MNTNSTNIISTNAIGPAMPIYVRHVAALLTIARFLHYVWEMPLLSDEAERAGAMTDNDFYNRKISKAARELSEALSEYTLFTIYPSTFIDDEDTRRQIDRMDPHCRAELEALWSFSGQMTELYAAEWREKRQQYQEPKELAPDTMGAQACNAIDATPVVDDEPAADVPPYAMIFERKGMKLFPRLPIHGSTNPIRRPDGVRWLSLEQAAAVSGEPAEELREFWTTYAADLLGDQAGETLEMLAIAMKPSEPRSS